jgi:aldehyde:ferredoxin oxidoreductase
MPEILRVNLTTREYSREEVPAAYAGLGGRGLTSALVAANVPPEADPLGPDNVIVLAPGIMAATSMPNNGRLSVGGKSPLTGTIKEANAGGNAAQKIARLGLAAVVIQGMASEPLTIAITRDGVAFHSATALWGEGNFAAFAQLQDRYPGSALVTIGPAGEKKLRAAAVIASSHDYHLRAAARGGLGAVLGSKRVKAIVIDDTGGPGVAVARPEQFKAATKALTEGILSHPLVGGLGAFGTPLLVGLMNEMGGLATKNFSRGTFDGAGRIGGEALAKHLGERKGAAARHNCMRGCIISCSQVYTDEEGKFLTSGLEFETIGLLGSNCEIDDLDVIARIDGICDDLGLDTIDVGGAVGVAMEAGRIPWGAGARVLELLESIRRDDPLGLLIGDGCAATGRALGVRRVPVVKGQSLSAYDPRILKGTGVTYATTPMGADHTCGNALPSPANPGYNPGSPSGQNEVSEFLQSWFAAIDTLGLCLFASVPMLDMPELQQQLVAALSAKLGVDLPEGHILALGRRVNLDERRFNSLAGFSPADDRLPAFFREERLTPDGSTFDVPDEDLDKVFAPVTGD